MKILTVVGNRPQFIKAAAVSAPLREHHQELLVHTGQHHDEQLSDVFFDELPIPAPDMNLRIAGGSNSSQTARMLSALEQVIAVHQPEAMLVYGDTNSTLAAALAAAQVAPATEPPPRQERLPGQAISSGADPAEAVGRRGPVPLIHIEAGMRSFDRSMPEEVNRVLCDHLATLLLCPTAAAAENLWAEGIGIAASGTDMSAGEQRPKQLRPIVHVIGDVMADIALRLQPQARADRAILRQLGLSAGSYLLLTSHRAGNVDAPQRLHALVGLIESLVGDGRWGPVVFPVHPRTRERLAATGLDRRLVDCPGLIECRPLGYMQTQTLLCNARALLTDSGGMQKEAYLAQVPCLTLRDRSEWIETIASGWNTLVDLDAGAVTAALERPLPQAHPELFGAGDAAMRCVAAIDELADLLGARPSADGAVGANMRATPVPARPDAAESVSVSSEQ